MKLTEIFNRAKEKPQLDEKDAQVARLAANVVKTLERYKAENRLIFELNEYINSEEFLSLVKEYDVPAAIRIFEAEKRLEKAHEEGRLSAVEEIYRRKEFPRAMKQASRNPFMGFLKISKEEFERIKKQLENG